VSCSNQSETRNSCSAPREPCNLQAIVEARHKPWREWSGLPRFGNRKIGALAHQQPAHSPCLATCPRHRRRSHRHTLRPKRTRTGLDTAFHPTHGAVVTASGEMRVPERAQDAGRPPRDEAPAPMRHCQGKRQGIVRRKPVAFVGECCEDGARSLPGVELKRCEASCPQHHAATAFGRP
jgi:hypothetical protein